VGLVREAEQSQGERTVTGQFETSVKGGNLPFGLCPANDRIGPEADMEARLIASLPEAFQRIVLRAIGVHMVSSRLFSMTAKAPMMSAGGRSRRGRRRPNR